MRSVFMLSATLAALAVPAAAAPGDGTREHYYTIKLTNAFVAQTRGSAAKGDEIHVESFSWGSPASAIELKPVYVTSYQTGGSGSDAAGRGTNELRMDDTAGSQKMQPGGGGAGGAVSGRITGIASDPSETSAQSGLPTGKRQHKPVKLTSPLEKGSVWIRVGSPWAGCRVGAAYPRLELAGRGKSYVLEDVTVGSCGGPAAARDGRPTEEIAFYYNKISF